jgi:asparagine synthase (glutamine-hydrolysing)
MCGICGIYEYRNPERAAPGMLDSMLAVIHHRGPDEDGRLIDGALAMGMRRLSIIDLAGGTQPLYNEDQTVGVLLNGEIYNYHSLRAALEQRGHRFRSNSDTEVIVHLYEEYGTDCLLQLRGMFGVAIWDGPKKRLIVARDHLGVKPIYYTTSGGRFVFASEIKSILQHPAITARLDMQGLSDYLSLRYIPAPRTLFEEIHALPPGHCIVCEPGKLWIEQYWELEFSEPEASAERSEGEYLEELDTLLREVVAMQLMSDVPFGAFLSGGVDSSTIVALMSGMLQEPVKTFSVGFAGEGSDAFSELPFARTVAQAFETEHHEVIVTAADLVNELERVTWHLDLPIADYAQIAYYKVAALAGRSVKMVLTGEGGDELFAGYGRYMGEKVHSWYQHVPGSLQSTLLRVVERLPQARREKAALYALSGASEAERFLHWIPNFNSSRKAALLSSEAQTALAGYQTSEGIARQFERSSTCNPLNRMLFVDTKTWLPDYLLNRGDKLTMAASLEGRVPLLDYKLVEYAARLPPHLKIKGLKRKYLLKKAASKFLPADIINRKKKGFPVPVPIWLRREANSFMRDLLAPETIKRRGYFSPAYVEQLMKEHESGFADHATMLYGLMTLELWFQRFIDRQGRP